MTEKKYAIDAGMGVRSGMMFLCPVKRDKDGKFIPDTSASRILCDSLEDREIVGIFHKDGPEALDAFCEEHKEEIRRVLAQLL
ncbi:MAG: hypothetical protein AAGC96_19715 [Pseudomonadota bacterium]